MRFPGLASLSLLWLLMNAAWPARAQVISLPSQPRTISGVVLNSVTGQPIARALVQMGAHAMLTDGEGHFDFDNITDYGFPSVTKPGYFSEDLPPSNLWAREGGTQPAGPLELKLVPEAIVSGQVTDPGGNPIQGITVQLRSLVISNGTKHWEQRMASVTNAEGEFRIAELQAGDYALQTGFRLEGPLDAETAAGYAVVSYPVLGVDGAGALKVHAGDQLQADLSTHLEKLYPVSFEVTGMPEFGWPNFTIRTADGVEISAMQRRDPETGQYRVYLPSGSYELRALGYVPPANPSRGIPQELIGRRLFTVTQAPVSVLRIALEPMAAVAVEIDMEKTAKAPSAPATPAPSDPAQLLSVMLVPAGADVPATMYSAMRLGDPAHPEVQRNEPLLIRNIPPGKYMLQAQPQWPWYVASAFCGGTDLTREPLAITGSAAGCTIRITLRDDSASLKVSTPETQEAAYIYAVPLDNLTRDVQTFAIANNGKGSLDSIAPGQYLLLASRHAQQLAFRDAQSLHRYELEGKRVDLSPGGTADIQLDVITGDL
jgi:hypothetical protein